MQVNADRRFSTVELSFTQPAQVRKEIIANPDLNTYRLGFTTRLLDSFSNGRIWFLDLVVAVANLWLFLLLGLTSWMLVKIYRKRRLMA